MKKAACSCALLALKKKKKSLRLEQLVNAPWLHEVYFVPCRSRMGTRGQLSEEPGGGRWDFCPAVTWGLPWLQCSQAQNDRAELVGRKHSCGREQEWCLRAPGRAWSRCSSRASAPDAAGRLFN